MIFDVRLGSGFVPLSVRGIEGLSDRPFHTFHESLDPCWLEFEKSYYNTIALHRQSSHFCWKFHSIGRRRRQRKIFTRASTHVDLSQQSDSSLTGNSSMMNNPDTLYNAVIRSAALRRLSSSSRTRVRTILRGNRDKNAFISTTFSCYGFSLAVYARKTSSRCKSFHIGHQVDRGQMLSQNSTEGFSTALFSLTSFGLPFLSTLSSLGSNPPFPQSAHSRVSAQ